MKAKIHPNWYNSKVSCVCGNTFTVGATVPSISVEVCSACHPFYTGQMKYVDTKGRVDAFLAKQAKATGGTTLSKAERRAMKRTERIQEDLSRPETFAEFKKLSKTA